MVTYIIITLIVFSCLIIMTSFMSEEALIIKANNNIFYHVVAKLTSNKYTGYKLTKEEEKALNEYMAKKAENDNHPIGSYFKLCDSLKDVLSYCGNFHNYSINFNMSEMAVGFVTLAVFAIVVALGVLL